jgi:DNA-nicking Smr family endonuclease
MREVREIKEFRSIPVRPGKAMIAQRKISSDKEEMKVLEEIIDGRRAVNLPDTQEYVEWINQDYRRNIVKKLHEGKFAVQDYLDLHGLCSGEAESSVEQFLKESMIKGHRCIKIIHGRDSGLQRPVLKEALIKWLSGRYRKHISPLSPPDNATAASAPLYPPSITSWQMRSLIILNAAYL